MPADTSTVAAVLRRQAESRGDHRLLVCDAEQLTYAEADLRSAELARGLIHLGVGKGSHVGVLYPNGTAFVVAMLGAARIGAVVVPFSTFATARELHDQLVDSDVTVLVAAAGYRSHDYAQRLIDLLGDTEFASRQTLFAPAVPQLRTVLIDRLPDGWESVDPPLLAASEDDVTGSDPLAIIYTSGSTSKPKGVIHTHAALVEHQRNLNAIRALGPDDILFCNSPFFWIGGFAFGVLATLVAGSTLLCSNAVDPADTLDLLEAERPTMGNGFAAGVAHLAAHPGFAERDLSSLRRGNLYPIMPVAARPRDAALRHNMLGLTEAGSVLLIDADESDQPKHRRGSYGRPAPGFDVKVVDTETGHEVPAGAQGELCIRGPSVMQRYHRRSREDCFDADGWFHTDDLVHVDTDGFVYFVGRRSTMIKTAGANVAPAEVERAITDAAGAVVYVIGLPDADRGQVVAAVVVLDDGGGFDEDAVRAHLRKALSTYKIPRRIVAISRSDLPVLSSGKVDLTKLAGLFDV